MNGTGGRGDGACAQALPRVAPGAGIPSQAVEGGLQRPEVPLAGIGRPGHHLDTGALGGDHLPLKHSGGWFAQLDIHLIPVREPQRAHLNDPAVDDRHANLDGAIVRVGQCSGGNSRVIGLPRGRR